MSDIYPIAVPKWGIEMVEGTITTWNKSQGDAVAKGDEVFEMESDKIVNVWEAPVDGVLRRVLAEPGDAHPVGALLGVIAPAAVSDADIDAFVGSYAGGETSDAPDQAAPEPTKPAAQTSDAYTRSSPSVRKLADELLERVNLAHAAKRRIRDYSGGMRQRIGVAQAIAGDPRLIVVDEPTVGLDPSERSRFYRLLAELAQERIVILSTHIVEDVAVLCPRFALLRAGELVTQASPEQVQRALDGKIFEARVEPEALAEIEARHEVTQSFFVAGRHHLRIYDEGGELPEAFRPVTASLEDAYHLLLGGHELEPVSAPNAGSSHRSVVRAAAS